MRVSAKSCLLTALLALAASTPTPGCGFTPVPEPPNINPPDTTLIEGIAERGDLHVLLEGSAGAVEPGLVLWAVNLDSTEPPVTAVSEEDGSFSLTVAGTVEDELRLQVRSDEARSEPVDVVVEETGELHRSARMECLRLAPPFDLDFETLAVDGRATLDVAISNDCTDEVIIDAARIRVEPSDYSVETAMPLSITAGGTAEIDVRLAPTAPGLIEELLLLGISAPEIERRPITLIGEGSDS